MTRRVVLLFQLNWRRYARRDSPSYSVTTWIPCFSWIGRDTPGELRQVIMWQHGFLVSAQLEEIRQARFARLFCDNMDSLFQLNWRRYARQDSPGYSVTTWIPCFSSIGGETPGKIRQVILWQHGFLVSAQLEEKRQASFARLFCDNMDSLFQLNWRRHARRASQVILWQHGFLFSAQLEEIRQASFTRLLCDNMDSLFQLNWRRYARRASPGYSVTTWFPCFSSIGGDTPGELRQVIMWQHGFLVSAQLKEIRQASFARLFCDNMDSFDNVQPRVFLHPLSTVLENIR